MAYKGHYNHDFLAIVLVATVEPLAIVLVATVGPPSVFAFRADTLLSKHANYNQSTSYNPSDWLILSDMKAMRNDTCSLADLKLPNCTTTYKFS